MQRDWELIRKLMLDVEKLKQGESLAPVSVDPDDPDKIGYHFKLMVDAGLIIGTNPCLEPNNFYMCYARCLTWIGHELLDFIRGDSMWLGIKKDCREKGLPLTYETVRATISKLVFEK